MKGVEGVGQKCAENSMAQILGVNFKESATHERQVGRMSGRGSCGKGARQKDGIAWYKHGAQALGLWLSGECGCG
jgi:hypothetical protein